MINLGFFKSAKRLKKILQGNIKNVIILHVSKSQIKYIRFEEANIREKKMKRGKIMSEIANALKTYFTSGASDTVSALAVVALIIIGICFIIPNEKIKNFAKDHLFHVVIGVAIVLLANTMVSNFVSNFQTQDQQNQQEQQNQDQNKGN